jgi:hypothetical protein
MYKNEDNVVFVNNKKSCDEKDMDVTKPSDNIKSTKFIGDDIVVPSIIRDVYLRICGRLTVRYYKKGDVIDIFSSHNFCNDTVSTIKSSDPRSFNVLTFNDKGWFRDYVFTMVNLPIRGNRVVGYLFHEEYILKSEDTLNNMLKCDIDKKTLLDCCTYMVNRMFDPMYSLILSEKFNDLSLTQCVLVTCILFRIKNTIALNPLDED